MKTTLTRIEMLLSIYCDRSLFYQKKAHKSRKKKRWLDASTTKFMLGIGDRMLYNYVKRGDLVSEKRGNANVYLESSISKFLKKQGEKN